MRDLPTLKRLVETAVSNGFEPPTERRLLSCYLMWCARMRSTRRWQADNAEKKRALNKRKWDEEKNDAAYHSVRLARRRELTRKRMANKGYRAKRNATRRAWWRKTHPNAMNGPPLPKGWRERAALERERSKGIPDRGFSVGRSRELEVYKVAM